MVQALVWNLGTCAPMSREKLKWQTHKSRSTDAEHRGGVACRSDEGAVMALEQRGGTVRPYRKVNR